jgi:hypothetical protein
VRESAPYLGATADFRARYGTALRAHLVQPGEATLREAYELGRTAVRHELSVIDLADVHHDALAAVSGELGLDADAIVVAGGFLVESLSAFEMIRRGYLEVREEATLERRRATMVRRLSNLLSDHSLTGNRPEPLREALQLVAEQARELVGAARCTVSADLDRDLHAGKNYSAVSEELEDEPAEEIEELVVPLRSLAGHELGSIAMTPPQGRHLTARDKEIIAHVAEMTSAAIERARAYSTRLDARGKE